MAFYFMKNTIKNREKQRSLLKKARRMLESLCQGINFQIFLKNIDLGSISEK